VLKKLRKSSSQVTLVLIGVAALPGCGSDEGKRDLYASREDCLADWGNKPEDCTPSTESQHRNRGFFYGPAYSSPHWYSSWGSSSGSKSSSSSSSRSFGSSGSSSRGGFGSSGRSSGG
jgi:uncharacterized membrane protein YgcG